MKTSWSRFVKSTAEELIKFVEEQENTNTKRKTVYDVELFKNFIQTLNPGLLDSTSHHELSPQVLNDHLSKFIFGVEKKMASTKDPQNWEVFFQASRDIWTNITTASQFLLMLCLKLQWLFWHKKELKAKGLGNKPRTSDSLTEKKKIKKLYTSKCLG